MVKLGLCVASSLVNAWLDSGVRMLLVRSWMTLDIRVALRLYLLHVSCLYQHLSWNNYHAWYGGDRKSVV